VGRGNILEVWRLTWLCIMWCIWREQNARSLEDIDFGCSAENNYIQCFIHMDSSTS
jgi:hypothetical protein